MLGGSSRMSPSKPPVSASASAVALQRRAAASAGIAAPPVAVAGALRSSKSASAACLRSLSSLTARRSSPSGAQAAQATAAVAHGGGACGARAPRSSPPCSSSSPRRRRMRGSRSLPSSLSQLFSPLRAVPVTSHESSPPRQARSPTFTTVSSAVPAPPSLRQQQQRPLSSSSSLNSAPLPPPPADGAPLAYEILQGNMLRGLTPGSRQPPTVVLVHGILGSRRNLAGFANRLLEGFPHWQALLVDLRCHGASARCRPTAEPEASDGVVSAAADVLALLQHLKLFPEVLIGHSFGGKVVMSMADQFGRRFGGSPLPRNVHVWVLDALPGEVRGDGPADSLADHPARLLDCLRALPTPLSSRGELQAALTKAGFSVGVARWAATNLAPLAEGDQSRLGWSVDLDGISSMYRSYERESLWEFLRSPAPGVDVSFVRAARSEYRWAGDDQRRIQGAGHAVHLLPGAGHWVHAENPDGLFELLAPSFGAAPDLHVQRMRPGSPGLI